MHPVVSYTLLRLGLFVVALALLLLVGFRDPILLALLAAVISALGSFALLRRQREGMSAWLAARAENRRPRARERGSREDAADEAWRAEHGDPPPTSLPGHDAS